MAHAPSPDPAFGLALNVNLKFYMLFLVGQQLLLAGMDERMRNVKIAPDGSLYVLTDGPEASLLRLVPSAEAQ